MVVISLKFTISIILAELQKNADFLSYLYMYILNGHFPYVPNTYYINIFVSGKMENLLVVFFRVCICNFYSLICFLVLASGCESSRCPTRRMALSQKLPIDQVDVAGKRVLVR